MTWSIAIWERSSLDEIELRNDQVQWWSLGLGCMSTARAGTPNAAELQDGGGKRWVDTEGRTWFDCRTDPIWLPSRKQVHSARVNNNYENLNHRKCLRELWPRYTRWKVKLPVVFYQIFERPHTIETEAKRPGARSSCCTVGNRWAAWAWSCSSGWQN